MASVPFNVLTLQVKSERQQTSRVTFVYLADSVSG